MRGLFALVFEADLLDFFFGDFPVGIADHFAPPEARLPQFEEALPLADDALTSSATTQVAIQFGDLTRD
jgi:hypothetical protein